jgi:hypothetical protein
MNCGSCWHTFAFHPGFSKFFELYFLMASKVLGNFLNSICLFWTLLASTKGIKASRHQGIKASRHQGIIVDTLGDFSASFSTPGSESRLLVHLFPRSNMRY